MCVFSLAACSGSPQAGVPAALPTAEPLTAPTLELPAVTLAPSRPVYVPPPAELCAQLAAAAGEAFPGVTFAVQSPVPFAEGNSGDTGSGCSITAMRQGGTTGAEEVLDTLVQVVGLGWSEVPEYQADGPTGRATAMYRDSGLMLLSVTAPTADLSGCLPGTAQDRCAPAPASGNLVLQIAVAEYSPGFSLDGHWVEQGPGPFRLDLYQEWRTLSGSAGMGAAGDSQEDPLEIVLTGRVTGDLAQVTCQSPSGTSPGTAVLQYLGDNRLLWKLTTPPAGGGILPLETNLERK